MMTFQLWLALSHPPIMHPLYQRMLVSAETPIPSFAWIIIMLAAPLLLAPAFIMIGFTYGSIWAVNISSTILKERTNGNYDLICLTSCGETGQLWMMSVACIHRHHVYQRIHQPVLWMIRGLFFVYLFAELGGFYPAVYSLLYLIIMTATLMAFMFINHCQSIVMGLLIGLVAPTYSEENIHPPILALLLFILAEFVPFAVVGAAIYFLVPGVYRSTASSVPVPAYLVITSLLLLLLVIHEIMIMKLWRYFLKRLHASKDEAFQLLKIYI